MRSEEARIGEAVASLTARLSNLGAPEPAPLANDIIHELIREGWRPRAPRIEHTINGGQTATPETARQYAEAARQALRSTGAGVGASEALEGAQIEGDDE